MEKSYAHLVYYIYMSLEHGFSKVLEPDLLGVVAIRVEVFDDCNEALCGSAKLIFYSVIFYSTIVIIFISKYVKDSPIV